MYISAYNIADTDALDRSDLEPVCYILPNIVHRLYAFQRLLRDSLILRSI